MRTRSSTCSNGRSGASDAADQRVQAQQKHEAAQEEEGHCLLMRAGVVRTSGSQVF
jgi:hypothetical protein